MSATKPAFCAPRSLSATSSPPDILHSPSALDTAFIVLDTVLAIALVLLASVIAFVLWRRRSRRRRPQDDISFEGPAGNETMNRGDLNRPFWPHQGIHHTHGDVGYTPQPFEMSADTTNLSIMSPPVQQHSTSYDPATVELYGEEPATELYSPCPASHPMPTPIRAGSRGMASATAGQLWSRFPWSQGSSRSSHNSPNYPPFEFNSEMFHGPHSTGSLQYGRSYPPDPILQFRPLGYTGHAMMLEPHAHRESGLTSSAGEGNGWSGQDDDFMLAGTETDLFAFSHQILA